MARTASGTARADAATREHLELVHSLAVGIVTQGLASSPGPTPQGRGPMYGVIHTYKKNAALRKMPLKGSTPEALGTATT